MPRGDLVAHHFADDLISTASLDRHCGRR
jgi:hypothetical protein